MALAGLVRSGAAPGAVEPLSRHEQCPNWEVPWMWVVPVASWPRQTLFPLALQFLNWLSGVAQHYMEARACSCPRRWAPGGSTEQRGGQRPAPAGVQSRVRARRCIVLSLGPDHRGCHCPPFCSCPLWCPASNPNKRGAYWLCFEPRQKGEILNWTLEIAFKQSFYSKTLFHY